MSIETGKAMNITVNKYDDVGSTVSIEVAYEVDTVLDVHDLVAHYWLLDDLECHADSRIFIGTIQRLPASMDDGDLLSLAQSVSDEMQSRRLGPFGPTLVGNDD